MIIGITGKKHSGKDTIAEYLVETRSFKRVAFADKLKEAVAALFQMPTGSMDYFKEHCMVGLSDQDSNLRMMTGREILQRFGTEVGREVFGENFWVDLLNLEYLNDHYPNVVVSDTRFLNEQKTIIDLKGVMMCVTRPETDADDDSHASEKIELYGETIFIHNDSTIDDLHRKIDRIMTLLTDDGA